MKEELLLKTAKKDLKQFDKKTKCWKKLKNAKSCCKDDQLNENLQKSLKDQEVAEKHANMQFLLVIYICYVICDICNKYAIYANMQMQRKNV